jgi:hypothetical protein
MGARFLRNQIRKTLPPPLHRPEESLPTPNKNTAYCTTVLQTLLEAWTIEILHACHGRTFHCRTIHLLIRTVVMQLYPFHLSFESGSLDDDSGG